MNNCWMAETQRSDVTPALERYNSIPAVASHSPARVCLRPIFRGQASALLAYLQQQACQTKTAGRQRVIGPSTCSLPFLEIYCRGISRAWRSAVDKRYHQLSDMVLAGPVESSLSL